MTLNGDYRHEEKYAIRLSDYYALRQRIKVVMKPDSHVQSDGCYQIRSVYFDNCDDKALREKVNGNPVREKFRIRYYNDDLSYLSLEKKIKHNDLCLKEDTLITAEQYHALLKGDTSWMLGHPASLVQELYCKMQYQQLKPRVLVSYRREPYVYEPGHVRVTFDSAIRTSLFRENFEDDPTRDIAATDQPQDMILEVKWTQFLPEVIAQVLQVGSIRVQAFSKYGACRRFG